jgi:hypothetical protein
VLTKVDSIKFHAPSNRAKKSKLMENVGQSTYASTDGLCFGTPPLP